jgi:hypothetical protein
MLGWSAKQNHILTGGGILNSCMIPGRDYRDPEDLPHYHLKTNSTWEYFVKWLIDNRRSDKIVGAWSRPIFMGGWEESGEFDTMVFNLQTPSIFIDLRIPTDRPQSLSSRNNLSSCDPEELRILARQHCFGGYSLPSEYNGDLVIIRHHVIDWNFHPSYPRDRPNKWRVQMNADGSSFKEYSFAVDDHNVPIYVERWARRAGDGNGQKYLSARRLPSPSNSSDTDSLPHRDALLVMIGNHFCFVEDRVISSSKFTGAPMGGAASLVDYALSVGDRESVEAFLDLKGSHGSVYDEEGNIIWRIEQSTHPWLEGTRIFNHPATPDEVQFYRYQYHGHGPMSSDDDFLLSAAAAAAVGQSNSLSNSHIDHHERFDAKSGFVIIQIRSERWAVLECNLEEKDLVELFSGIP